MPKLLIKEDYDCVPILALVPHDDIDPRRMGHLNVIDVTDEDAARFEAVIKAYWAVQHELQLRNDLAEKKTEVYEMEKRLHLHKRGGDSDA